MERKTKKSQPGIAEALKARSTKTDALKSKFLIVYKSKACNISQSVEAVGMTRSTFYEWKRGDHKFRESAEEIESSLIDFAESSLLKNIQAGREASIIFFLCNRASDRWRNVQRVEGHHQVETTDMDATRKARLATFLSGISPEPLLAAQTVPSGHQRAEPSPTTPVKA